MNAIILNCRGIGRPSIIRQLKLLLKHHRPQFIFLSEIKCNDLDIVSKLVRSLKFDFFELVLATGKAGGLLLARRNTCHLKVVLMSTFFY